MLDAQVECPPDAIPCRVKAPKGTRVVTMGTAGADSLLNDAIFLRESDTLVEFSAEGRVRIDTLAPGRFRVRLTGENDGEYAVRVVRDYFRNRNMPHYRPIDRRRSPHAPTGWMAWNIYFDQATAKDNLDEARLGAKHLKRFGLEYWSVESWQGNSDALPVAHFHNLDLSCNERQFPQGMKAVADEIRVLGFKPGLWIVPWGTGNKAFYDAHRSWFIHEPDGRPMSAWPGRYILDITNDEALEYVRKMIRTYAEDWGYEFFKIDGMGAGFGWPSLKMMRPEIKRSLARPDLKDPVYRWTHMFREAMGDRYFLACGAALTSPGLEDCDATRIGGDIVHPNKPVQWDNVLMQASATLRRYYSHNIVAWNDDGMGDRAGGTTGFEASGRVGSFVFREDAGAVAGLGIFTSQGGDIAQFDQRRIADRCASTRSTSCFPCGTLPSRRRTRPGTWWHSATGARRGRRSRSRSRSLALTQMGSTRSTRHGRRNGWATRRTASPWTCRRMRFGSSPSIRGATAPFCCPPTAISRAEPRTLRPSP